MRMHRLRFIVLSAVVVGCSRGAPTAVDASIPADATSASAPTDAQGQAGPASVPVSDVAVGPADAVPPEPKNPTAEELAPVWEEIARCEPLRDTDLTDPCAARKALMERVEKARSEETTHPEKLAELRLALVEHIIEGTDPAARKAAVWAYENSGIGARDAVMATRLVAALREVGAEEHERGEGIAKALGREFYFCDDKQMREQLVALLGDKSLKSIAGRVDLIGTAAARAMNRDEADSKPLLEVLKGLASDPGERNEVRLAAIEGLGRNLGVADDANLVTFIVKLGADGDAEVRAAATLILGETTDGAGLGIARNRLKEVFTGEDRDPRLIDAAAIALSRKLDDETIDDLFMSYQKDPAKASRAMAKLLLELKVWDSNATSREGRKRFETLVGDTSLPPETRVELMLALARLGSMDKTCSRFVGDADPSVKKGAEACVARAREAVFRIADRELSVGLTSEEVKTRIEGASLEDVGADVVEQFEEIMPKRRGASYKRWSIEGNDELFLGFVDDKLVDMGWPSSTAGETDLQSAFKSDLENRVGQPEAEGGFLVWRIGETRVRRQCWGGGDSGDSGCAWAVLGKGR
jgi:hypothetical protein